MSSTLKTKADLQDNQEVWIAGHDDRGYRARITTVNPEGKPRFVEIQYVEQVYGPVDSSIKLGVTKEIVGVETLTTKKIGHPNNFKKEFSASAKGMKSVIPSASASTRGGRRRSLRKVRKVTRRKQKLLRKNT